jgi:hypothetical protein
VDASVWLSLTDLNEILNHEPHPERLISGLVMNEEGEKSKYSEFDIRVFKPPYPNKMKGGISRAHNCALRYFLKL